jgi:hypothetical protein
MSQPLRTLWMRLCTFRAEGSGGSYVQSADEFAARLWEQATDDDRIQHIRVRSGEHLDVACLDIGLLMMADSDDTAYAVGARICRAALAVDPGVFGWTLHSL